jgi:hypothetical protein
LTFFAAKHASASFAYLGGASRAITTSTTQRQ